ncbi:complement component C9 [Anolis carolinensis]|uniref:complement component C9 n=1 Tax=Anolis carolinensis TaxID=28377 RepID=UPI002F2B6CB6
MSRLLLLTGVLFTFGINSFVSTERIRLPRESNAPPPVECLLSNWSEWGPCNPCVKERYRSRSVLKYGQFGGKACLEPLGHRESCEPDVPCREEEVDCGKDFQCENGQCIKTRLVCNTEDDCGDMSDEADCEDNRPAPCRDRILDVSELGRIAGHGINVLGMRPQASPFYNEFYNGVCDRVRDGNSGIYYRKPWNVAVLNYETRGGKNFRAEYYADQVTALKEVLSETQQTFKSSLSLKMNPTEISEGNTSALTNLSTSFTTVHSSSIRDYLRESKGKEQLFLHVKSSIELGSFIMRTRDLRLNDWFLDDLKNLPTTYDRGEYFKFLETHGTHYARKGTFGGKYELLYVLDSETMKKEGVTITDVKTCLGYDVEFGIKTSDFDAKLPISKVKCTTDKMRQVSNKTTVSLINDVVSIVQGGKITVLVKLKEQLSKGNKVANIEDYVEWAATLPDAPVIISQELSPISDLVPLKMPDSTIKKRNLDRGVEDYIAEYNVCKCQPCQNGGTVLLINGNCECGCTPYFKGDVCQTPTSTFVPGQVATNGGWSCWSNWSPCKEGQRTRTRQCDNPEPTAGGNPCAGSNSEIGYCSSAE